MTDRLLASLMFFTRLPFWRIKRIGSENFKYVVNYWPFTGWITGGCMALTFWGVAACMPVPLAAIAAIACRILITGALHEDGLTDFFDGFGGGTHRSRILEIMKDSHIGTYGVAGLTLYLGLLVCCLVYLPIEQAPALILLADVLGKVNGSLLIKQLPYARKEKEAKSGVVYKRPDNKAFFFHLCRCTVALLPAVIWVYFLQPNIHLVLLVAPFLLELGLAYFIKKRIQGYTGDCCGAVFLLCELSIYLIYLL